MGKRKIDFEKLHQLLQCGESIKEIANHFGTSTVAIWKARKKLNLGIVKTNPSPELVQKIVQSDHDFVTRLRKYAEVTDRLLGESEADLLKVKNRREKRAIQEVIIKLSKEMRGQTETLVMVISTYKNLEGRLLFEEEILSYLDGLDPGTRNRIIAGLKEKHAERMSVRLPL